MVKNRVQIDFPLEMVFGDYKGAFCEGYYKYSLGDEFFYNDCQKRIELFEDALRDGVLDDADFDRFEASCDKRFQYCYEYNSLRNLHAALRRFSEIDGNNEHLSPDEAAEFRDWFEKRGYSKIFDSFMENRAAFGARLLCNGANPCNALIDADEFVLVVHPTAEYDGSDARHNIDREIEVAKAAGIPVAYLVQPEKNFIDFYPKDLHPDYLIPSKNGEHKIEFSGRKVTLMGGYFSHCLSIALGYLLVNVKTDDLTVKIPIESVYVGGGGTLEVSLGHLGNGGQKYTMTGMVRRIIEKGGIMDKLAVANVYWKTIPMGTFKGRSRNGLNLTVVFD